MLEAKQDAKQNKKTTRINSTIDSKLEKRFRDTVYKKWGFKKGNIQDGLEEAIDLWINQEVDRRTREKKDD